MPNSTRTSTSRSKDNKGGSSSSSSSSITYPKNARANWFNIVLAVLLPLIIASNLAGLLQIQSIINSNQRGAVEAREANADRQVEIKEYIKCIILLRFNEPPIGPDSTKVQVTEALDNCAAQGKS